MPADASLTPAIRPTGSQLSTPVSGRSSSLSTGKTPTRLRRIAVFAVRGELQWQVALIYIAAQVIDGIVGVWVAHLMFELPVVQLSLTQRTGAGQWLAEAVASFGLLLTILGCAARTPAAIPYAVGLYITSAYRFTASTSFANPAVTIARSLSDTFAGIAPGGVPGFILAQFAGALAAVILARWLLEEDGKASSR